MLTVPPQDASALGGDTIPAPYAESSEARERVTFGIDASAPRSAERVLLALIRLLELRLRHQWQCVATESADVVFAPAETRPSGASYVIPIGSVNDDRRTHIVAPIHPTDVLYHLNRAGDVISERRALPESTRKLDQPINATVVSPAAETVSPAVLSSQPPRMRLLSWPAYELIRSDPSGLRIATLLAAREWSADELALRVQIPRERCDQFLNLLVGRGYGAWLGQDLAQADALDRKGTAAPNATNHSNAQRKSLVAFIRRKLQI